MPQPNRKQGGGKLKRKQQAQAYAEYQTRQQAKSGRAEAKARATYKPGPTTTAPGPSTSPTPAAPPTPKYGPLMQRAQRDAQLLYGDQILRAQAAQQNAGTHFDAYKADLAAAQGQTAARYAAAQQAVAGPTVGPAVAGADEAAAAASRDIMIKAAQNLLTTQGAAQQDYFTGRQTVGSAQQLQSRTQAGAEVNRLATERDTYALGKRDEYRDQAHTKRLEEKVFGLDVAKAQADAADKAADNRRQAREDRRARRDDRREQREAGGEVNSYGYTDKQWKGMTTAQRQAAIKDYKKNTTLPPSKDPAAKGAFTPLQQSEARKSIRKAVGLVESKPAYSNDYYKQAKNALINEKDMDPAIASAAVQLVRFGKVSPAIARVLKRDYGITVKPRKKSGKITPTQQPNQNFAPSKPGGPNRPN